MGVVDMVVTYSRSALEYPLPPRRYRLSRSPAWSFLRSDEDHFPLKKQALQSIYSLRGSILSEIERVEEHQLPSSGPPPRACSSGDRATSSGAKWLDYGEKEDQPRFRLASTKRAGLEGFEPPTHGTGNRCSIP